MSTKEPGHMMESLKQVWAQLKELEALDGDDLDKFEARRVEQPSPREVIDSVCKIVETRFASGSFRYLKSQRTLKKKDKDLKSEIHLYTSRNNQRGLSAVIRPHVTVSSARLKAWRSTQSNPARNDGFVAGHTIDSILKQAEDQEFDSTCAWNFAAEDTRSQTIDDMIAFLEKYALPFLDMFHRPDDVISTLLYGKRDQEGSTGIPGFRLSDAIEYTLCFGKTDQAGAILDRAYDQHKDWSEKVRETIAECETHGLPAHCPWGGAGEIAWLKLHYEIGTFIPDGVQGPGTGRRRHARRHRDG